MFSIMTFSRFILVCSGQAHMLVFLGFKHEFLNTHCLCDVILCSMMYLFYEQYMHHFKKCNQPNLNMNIHASSVSGPKFMCECIYKNLAD